MRNRTYSATFVRISIPSMHEAGQSLDIVTKNPPNPHPTSKYLTIRTPLNFGYSSSQHTSSGFASLVKKQMRFLELHFKIENIISFHSTGQSCH